MSPLTSSHHFKLFVANIKKRLFTKTSLLHTQNKNFMRVKGRVQLSTYRMRSRELKVTDEFLEHVKSLPLQYEKGIYFAFLEDYGTHYTKNGKSGGEYDLVYVLNQDTIKTRRRSLGKCLRLHSDCRQKCPKPELLLFFCLYLIFLMAV